MPKRLLRRLAVVTGVGAVAAAGFGIGAYASAPKVTTPTQGPYHVCVNGKTHTVTTIWGQNAHPSCPAGDQLFLWSVRGAKGDTGPRGPQGPKGAPGDPAAVVTATTAFVNWPDGGAALGTTEWADDDFVRTLAISRGPSADPGNCGSGATACWHYTATVTDRGTATTVDGNHTPNSHFGGTVAGNFNLTMSGTAHYDFFASSGKPDAALVPTRNDGANAIGTTSSWYEQAFPNGTTFGGDGMGNYSWTYASPCERWVDAVQPGDDGQGASDGNITHDCSTPTWRAEVDNGKQFSLSSAPLADTSAPNGGYADAGVVVAAGAIDDLTTSSFDYTGTAGLAVNVWIGNGPQASTPGIYPLDSVDFCYGLGQYDQGGNLSGFEMMSQCGADAGKTLTVNEIKNDFPGLQAYVWVGVTNSGTTSGSVSRVSHQPVHASFGVRTNGDGTLTSSVTAGA